ncbi:hypothetical protein CPLU01_01243 [Colletotrichum plurivorum]|uniref:Uncharacterized protein n=1 Tax=Colletotrichum plurivorum TaxID=2175906 RepID=A0A8H6NPP5_9PEZI|nr:hypothetical protein CPLU01_01243 [Colletotrichum plurivorum]
MTPDAGKARHPRVAVPPRGGESGSSVTMTPGPNGIETQHSNEGPAESSAYHEVQVEDGNGNFQERIANVNGGKHSLIASFLVRDLCLEPRVLSPTLARKWYFTSVGSPQLTHYVDIKVRVPLHDIPPTKLSIGVVDADGTLPEPGFILGKGFHNKTGGVLAPPQVTGFGTARLGQADPGEHGVPRLLELDGVRPSGIPLLAHIVDHVEDEQPDVSAVDPPDLNLLNLPGFGPGPHTGPSRGTSVVGGMSLSTTRDPIRSSAPTSVTPEEASPIAKDTPNDFSVPHMETSDDRENTHRFFVTERPTSFPADIP